MATQNRRSIKVAEPPVDNVDDTMNVSVDFVGSNPDHREEIEELPIDLLEVDHSIQRALQHGEIARILKKFNEAALGTLTVSAREGEINGQRAFTYVLLDGQQRTAVLRQKNWRKPVTCIVHYNLTRAEEAELFLLLNERNSVGPWDRFKASLVAERPVAQGIAQVLEDLDIPLGPPHGFNAIVAAERVYNEGGIAALRWSLTMLKEIYNSGSDDGGYDGRVIRAFAFLYGKFHGLMDEEALRRKLFAEGGGLSGLLGRGRVIEQVYRGSIIASIAEAIIVTYNKSTRGNTRNGKALPSVLGKREPGRRAQEALADMGSIDADAELAGEDE